MATTAAPQNITTTALDVPQPDGIGLLSPAETGLPPALWGPADPAEIARRIRAETVDTLPAGHALLARLLLAEADPPPATGGSGELLLARIDKLLDLGLVEEATALVAQAGMATPELFRRAFDVALLTGEEDRACAEMRARPDIAPTIPARVFCLARGGDWAAAALTLGTARALEQITPEEEALVSRFLDPELSDGAPPLQPPERVTPLNFRMHAAIGEPLSSSALPRAFAHADLLPTAGWKAQIEAAERLARTSALAPERLIALYAERRPAASGGVWERAEAVQRLDRALAARDTEAVATVLPTAWEEMRGAGLGHVLGAVYGPRLVALDLPSEASALAFRIALLSPDYEDVATAWTPRDDEENLLIAVARGLDLPRSIGAVGFALAGLGSTARKPARSAPLVAEGRLGEAILTGLDDLAAGHAGDPRRMADALALFRSVGLESTARRAALEFLILSDPA